MLSNFSMRHREQGRFWLLYKLWFYFMQNVFAQYLMVILTILFVLSLILGLYEAWGELDKLILNGFFVCMFFNSLVSFWNELFIFYFQFYFFNIKTRGIIRIWSGKLLIVFSENTEMEYNKIMTIKDSEVQSFIKDYTKEANNLHSFNWVFGHFINVCFLAYPLFASQRELPFTMFIPFINELETPAYYFIYAFQIVLTFFGCCMYVTLTTFFTSSTFFAMLQMKTLQHLLINIWQKGDTVEIIEHKLNRCIKMHRKIIFYVKKINNIVAYMCLSELLCFGFVLSALLILLNIVCIRNKFLLSSNDELKYLQTESIPKYILTCIYIFMILVNLQAFYFQSNKVREESMEIANAAYNTPFWNFSAPMKKKLILIIQRAQKPMEVCISHVFQ